MPRRITAPKPRFNPHNPSKEETYLHLIFRYEYRGKTRVLSFPTGKKIKTNLWDKKAQRMIEPDPPDPELRELNKELNRIAEITSDIYTEFKNDISPKEFKEKLHARLHNLEELGQNNEELDFLGFCQWFIEYREKNNPKNDSANKRLKITLGLIKDFSKEKKELFDFEDINPEWSKKFRDFLFNDRKLSINYVRRILKYVRQFMNAARKHKYTKEIGDKYDGFQIKKADPEHVYLTIEELKKLYNTNLKPHQEGLKDWFVIACLTGLRISDWSQLDPEFFYEYKGLLMQDIKTKKTGTWVTVLINDVVQNICKKYNNELPKIKSEPYFNREIKEICRIAGITQKVKILDSTGGDRDNLVTYKKYEAVSSATGRRTYVSNKIQQGSDRADISKTTGHDSTKMLEHYNKVERQEGAFRVSQKEKNLYKGW